MTLIWIRIRKAATCSRVPRETQKKPLWLPHRPHTNKHWLQRTTQTDHKCAGGGAVLCLSSRRNTLVGGLLDSQAGAQPERAALKEECFSQRPQSRFLLLVVTCKQNGNVGDFIHRGFTTNLMKILDFSCTLSLPVCVWLIPESVNLLIYWFVYFCVTLTNSLPVH